MPIDISLDEDLDAIATYRAQLNRCSGQLDMWSSDVRNQRGRALANWQGQAADAFTRACDTVVKDMDDFTHDLATYITAVSTFHDTINAVHREYQNILRDAEAVPLSVMFDGATTVQIIEPGPPSPLDQPPPASMTPQQVAQVQEFNRRQSAYDALAARALKQAPIRAAAHRAFRRACLELKAPALAYVRLRPGPESLREENDETVEDTAKSAYSQGLEEADKRLEKEIEGGGTGGDLRGSLKGLGIIDKSQDRIDTASDAYKDFKEQWDFDAHDPSMSDEVRMRRALFYAETRSVTEKGAETIGEKLGQAGGATLPVPGMSFLFGVLGGQGGKATYDDMYEDERADLERQLDDLNGGH